MSYPAWDRYLKYLGLASVVLITSGYAYDKQMGIIVGSALSFGVPVSILFVAFLGLPRFTVGASALLFARFWCIDFRLLIHWAGGTWILTVLCVVYEYLTGSGGIGRHIALFEFGPSHSFTSNREGSYTRAIVKQSTHAARLGESALRFVPYEFLEFLGRKDISEVQLGDSVSSEMTVLFSDIRSFTSLSEGMNPQREFRVCE